MIAKFKNSMKKIENKVKEGSQKAESKQQRGSGKHKKIKGKKKSNPEVQYPKNWRSREKEQRKWDRKHFQRKNI